MPEIAVDVWYKVGGRDEAPGRTGFAHLFEHVMFQGTKHIAEDKHFEYLQKAGASSVNGSTSHDRTNYFEVVPSNQLELALWLESERMGFLLDRTGFKETVDNQRDVVKNERRQRYENRPAGLISEGAARGALPARSPLLPPGHRLDGGPDGGLGRRRQGVLPHLLRAGQRDAGHRGRLRSRQDQAAGRAVLRPHPGAASRSRAAPAPEVRLTAVKRIAMEAKVQQPQLYVTYPTPANFAPGDRELDLLGIALAGGKSSRLYKRLVYDMKIAQSVTAAQQSQLLASSFEITASPMPGHTLDEILAVIDEEIAALQAKPLDAAELDRAKNQLESDTVRSLESLLARAERLQSYNYLVGDPGFVTEDLRRYRAVDAAAIQRVAQQYLKKDARVVVTIDPNPDAPIMGRIKK